MEVHNSFCSGHKATQLQPRGVGKGRPSREVWYGHAWGTEGLRKILKGLDLDQRHPIDIILQGLMHSNVQTW
jgi:hypothetical protein